MDYRKFLGREETAVLPYLGGTFVESKERRLRLESAFEPLGWYTFSVKGRQATPQTPAEAPSMHDLPLVRGHFLDGALVREGGNREPLYLVPADEPARFAPLKARRWHSGELLFDGLEFESEIESAVRETLALDQGLAALKGVPATLRAAFAYALLDAASRRLRIPYAPAEVRHRLTHVADGAVAPAEQVLRELDQEREVARREMAEMERRRAAAAAAHELRVAREGRIAEARRLEREEPRRWREVLHERAEAALSAAGARLEQSRVSEDRRLEVIFRFMGHRFISVIDAHTFRVIDSGICLGHPPRDEWLTLDSLCAVIREAIETDALVILRFP